MKNPFSRLHISRKLNVPLKHKLIFKIASFILAFILCALVCTVFSSEGGFTGFTGFLEAVFSAPFSSDKQIVFLFEEFALLLGISIALLPAYKMRFWNLGAEGQVLLGGFAAATVSKFIGPHVPTFLCVILMILAAIVAGGLWSFIPAIFRAKFGTNETLFTLMLNYIAMGLVVFFIRYWDPAHGLMEGLTHGMFPNIFGQPYILTIFAVAIMFVLMIFYIKKSKHGYELTVVGENVRTAKYIGINDKKVIIRTAILSGALCGLMGLFIVAYSRNVAFNLCDGRGFTAVLIVWLGHFNPAEIAVSSMLLALLTRGSSRAQTLFDLGSSFPAVCMGVFFLTILAFEFFLNYKISISKDVEGKEEKK